MTEEVVQKIVWEKLRGFIRIVVDDLLKMRLERAQKQSFLNG